MYDLWLLTCVMDKMYWYRWVILSVLHSYGGSLQQCLVGTGYHSTFWLGIISTDNLWTRGAAGRMCFCFFPQWAQALSTLQSFKTCPLFKHLKQYPFSFLFLAFSVLNLEHSSTCIKAAAHVPVRPSVPDTVKRGNNNNSHVWPVVARYIMLRLKVRSVLQGSTAVGRYENSYELHSYSSRWKMHVYL